MNTSVLTLVRDRRAHLVNLMHGLNAQSRPPDELVIAWMQPEIEPDLPATGFAVRHIRVEGSDLPLARARNLAAERAAHEGLIFLDVDCIPAPELVQRYLDALAERAGLFMGEVRYLPADAVRVDADGTPDFERMDRLGEIHPARPRLKTDAPVSEGDPGQLWGLSFALRRADHARAGGFDEAYEGYGGEETDYAWRLAAAGVDFYWLAGARAWHQHHPLYRPPYPHFEAIVTNARRFHARWGRWCMDYWLGMFRDAGLIDWSPAADDIVVRRQPSPEEIRAARLDGEVRYG
ncbi:galactosyltransferase-related protein [Salinisphaera sp.]|uniref:glycosyltransferase family 2 protein n=1 Tax=Salinisphaera sp. TaxID=1914330 RepID=UPI0025E404CF|nr:galactosyltransferase-related protein [Salinisphaera sp.]